jgi:hypothetical protein
MIHHYHRIVMALCNVLLNLKLLQLHEPIQLLALSFRHQYLLQISKMLDGEQALSKEIVTKNVLLMHLSVIHNVVEMVDGMTS